MEPQARRVDVARLDYDPPRAKIPCGVLLAFFFYRHIPRPRFGDILAQRGGGPKVAVIREAQGVSGDSRIGGGAAEADHGILFPRRMHAPMHTCVVEPAVAVDSSG